MPAWRLIKQTWCGWPSKPKGLVEMIGGSYLSATPHITYKYLLESLIRENIAVHAWRYIPSFDHQSQSNQAWRQLRACKLMLENRIGESYMPLRIGHSLGCKLHLLAPDGGRNSSSLVTMSFNNFNAKKSIPMLGKISKKLRFNTEFSPSPNETMNIISKKYLQPKNLLIRFSDDNLDQSNLLMKSLQARDNDISEELILEGNHLSPVSSGFRSKILGEWDSVSSKKSNIDKIVETINLYLIKK